MIALILPNVHQVQEHECPNCLGRFRTCSGVAVNPTSRAPRQGDLTICDKCGTILAFNEVMDVEVVCEDQLEEEDPKLREALLTIQNHIRKKI